MISSKALAIILSLSLLIFVVELVRREKLTFKYAFGWMMAAVLAMIFAIFDQWLFQLSSLLGFELPSNFVFFILLSMFTFLSLILTIFLCQQDSRNDTIAQKIGIFEFEMKQLKEKIGAVRDSKDE